MKSWYFAAFGIGLLVGIVIAWLFCPWLRPPETTFEFARTHPAGVEGGKTDLYVQMKQGRKIVFFNNDQEVSQKFQATFDYGTVEPGQGDIEPGNKVTVQQGEKKWVRISNDIADGKVVKFTWSTEVSPAQPGSGVIIQGGP